MCLSAKPVVDGLEREYDGKAEVVRANIESPAGAALAERYGLDVVPSFMVFDPDGEIALRAEGTGGVPVADIRRALRRAGA